MYIVHICTTDRSTSSPPPPPLEQEPLDEQELVDLAGGLDLARWYLTEDLELDPEARLESGRGTDRRSAPSTSKII